MTDEYESLKLENQICFPLYACSKEVVRLYHPILSELDLTYTQYLSMMVLWEHGEISMKDLGKKLYLDSGTLTPLIRSLESKSYVQKERSASDERSVIIKLLPRGEELREKAKYVPIQLASCVPLESDEAQELYRLLYKILGIIQERN